MSRLDDKLPREIIESIRLVLIESSGGGVSSRFEDLVQSLDNVAVRSKCYLALAHNVSYINPVFHQKLIYHIFGFNFFESNEEITIRYCELIKHLNAAHGGYYLTKTFSHIVSFLKPKMLEGKVGEDAVKMAEPYVHNLIRELLKIPGSGPQLVSELSHRYPYISDESLAHVTFVRNLLIIVKNNRVLTEGIFQIIIDRILLLDVHIRVEDAQKHEGIKQDDLDEVPQFEMDEVKKDNRKNGDDPKELAIKLDALIDLIIKFISSCDVEHQDILFLVLLKSFETFILPTYKPKYTQFLIFYMCGLKESYLNEYLEFLLTKLEREEFSLHRPTPILLSTASYLGIFLIF